MYMYKQSMLSVSRLCTVGQAKEKKNKEFTFLENEAFASIENDNLTIIC